MLGFSMIRSTHKHVRPAPYKRFVRPRWGLLESLQGVKDLFVPAYKERPTLDIIKETCTKQNVTGLTDKVTTTEYSYGPAPNPYAWAYHTQGQMVYIVTTETHWNTTFDFFPKYCPNEDLGAYIYLLLLITRLICFLSFYLQNTLASFLRFPSLIQSSFVVKPIPAPGAVVLGGPLDPRYIRGPKALEAAKRAGYDML